MRHLLLALFGCALVPLLNAAPAPPVKKSIACEDRGMYIGNIIDASWSLRIADSPKRTWVHRFTDTHSGTRPTTKNEASGTYELVGDLAIFTGTLTRSEAKPIEVRFALNYGFPDGRVEFDGCFPAAGGTLRYHRKLFDKRDGEWQPREERDLSLAATPPPREGPWKVKFTGQRIRWDKDGKEVRQKVDEEVVYNKGDNGAWNTDRRGTWLPLVLFPKAKDGELVSVSLWPPYIYALRGFSPDIATMPLGD